MIKFPELMYYAECEGILPTRIGKINAIIKDIKAYPEPSIDEKTFIDICNSHGIDYKDFSINEFKYILASIR